MSNTPRVGIEVAVDGSAAEAGLERVENAVTRTGRSLNTLGNTGGAALNNVGTQGASAAGRVDAATRNMITSIQRTTAALDAGSRSSREYYEALASQRGINVNALRPYLEQLNEVAARQEAARRGLDSSAGALGRVGASAAQTAAAMRGVPAQITDIVTAIQGGQAPLTVFLQQGGQLRDMFGSAGGAARALGSTVLGMVNPFAIAAAAALTLGVAYQQGSAEAIAYNRALIMSGNVAATTAGQLADMARNISATVGTQGEAAAALTALAGTGAVASGNLQQFGEVAVRVQKSIGTSVEETAKSFAELAKSPLAATEKLNEQYHYLTLSVYEHIKGLEQQGKMLEAGEAAQKAYAEAMGERASAIKANLGTVQRAWEGVTGVAKGAWDAMLNVGRADSLDEKLANVAAKIAANQKKLYSFIDGPEAKAEIERLRTEQDLLQSQQREQGKANEQKVAANKLAAAGIEWSKEYTKYLDKEAQKKNELAAATNKALAANVALDSEQFKAVKKGIEDKFEDKGAAAALKKQLDDRNNLAKAALETQRNIEKEMAAGALAALESQHKQALVSDEAYYTAKRDLQLKDVDAEAALLQKQAARSGKKGDLAEQEKYLGALKVLEQRRANIVQGTQNLINESLATTSKAFADQVRSWTQATAAEAAQLIDELALFGANAEARKIATAQLKVEADARQLIAAQVKAGRPFNQAQLDDLQSEVDKRKENIAAIMGERQALSGAEQLHAENAKFAADSIIDEKARASALLEIDAQTWRDRILLAEEGSEARKRLESEFGQWYKNQLAKPELEAQRKLWGDIESTAHDTFVSIFDSGKSAAQRLRDTLKNVLFDWLYQQTLKKWIINLQASSDGSALSSIASAVGGGSTDSSGSSLLGGASNLLSIGKTIYQGFTGGLASSMGGYISSLGNLFGSQAVSAFGAGMGMTTAQAGTAAAAYGGTGTAVGGGLSAGASTASTIPIIGWIIAGMMANNSYFKQGWNIDGQTEDISKMFLRSMPKAGLLGGDIGAGLMGTGAIATVGINAANSVLKKIGLSDQMASLISGSSLWTKAFGHQKPTLTGEGMATTFDSTGVVGENWANVQQKGGWFRSDKNYTIKDDLSSDVVGGLATSFSSMKSMAEQLATSMGVSTESLKSFKYASNITFDKDASKRDQQVIDMLADVGNALATNLVPNIASFATKGEAASVTLQRLATEFVQTNAIMHALGVDGAQAFGAVGLASIAARERLIALAGGVDALASQTDFFTQNFLTQAEQMAPAQEALADQMAALGYAGVTTVDQFKNAVLGLASSGALATEAGATAYAGLMAIAPAFKTIADYTAQIDADKAARAAEDLAKATELASERRGLEIQLMELSGDAAGALAARRADELAAADATLRPLYQLIYARQDEATAVQAAAEAADEKARIEAEAAQAAEAAADKARQIAQQAAQLDIQVMQLQGDAAGALAAQRAIELAGVDETLRARYLMIYALQDEKTAAEAAAKALTDNETALRGFVTAAMSGVSRAIDAQKTAVQKAYEESMAAVQLRIDGVSASVSRLSDLSGVLRGGLDSMTMVGMEDANRASAQAQIEAVLAIARAGGALPAADSIRDAVGLASQSSTDGFASFLDYQRDFARTSAALAELAGISDGQLSDAQKQLKALDDQSTMLKDANTAEIGRLDGLLAAAQAQVDAINGVDGSVLSVAAAIATLNASIAGLKAGATPSNPGGAGLTVDGLYQSVLGRSADAGGLSFWTQAYGSSVDQTEMADFIKAAAPELAAKQGGTLKEWLRAHGVPGYAAGGSHDGGWRVVGEAGPELEFTGPSRIYSNGASRNLFEGMEKRLASLEQVMATGLSRLIAETKRSADAAENVAEHTRNEEEIA